MIQILHLEDNLLDARLIKERLIDDNLQPEVTLVSKEQDFIQALQDHSFDIILADYYLPGFTGLEGLKIVQELHITTPVILISGKLGEEAAVESLQKGAVDYILKDNLQRLSPAVIRAMEEYEQQRRNREIELELIKSGELFRTAESIGRLGTFEWNFSNGDLYWSDGIYAIFGYDKADTFPTFDLYAQHVHPDSQEEVSKSIQHCIETQSSLDSTYRIISQSGETKHIRTIGSVYPDLTGTPTILVGVCQDITAQINAIIKLEKSEEKYRTLVEQATDGILIADGMLTIKEANQSALHILECEDSTLIINQKPNSFLPLHEIEKEPIRLEKIHEGPITNVREVTTFQGNLKVLEITSKLISDNRIQTVLRDVTDREEARRELEELNKSLDARVKQAVSEARENAEKFRLISENSSDLITQSDYSGKITYVSPSVKDILGNSPADYFSKPFVQLLPTEWHQQWEELMEKLIQRKSEHLTLQHEIYQRSGSTIWVETVCKGIWDTNGQLNIIQTASRDIHDRKKAEIETKRAIERERELTDLRAHFVSMASHQFRTPLAVINANVELMELIQIDKVDPRVKNILGRITKETSRLTELMNDVLILGRLNARRLETTPEKVNISDLVMKLVEEHFFQQKDGRNVVISVIGPPPVVVLDPSLTGHILTNLINNAFKYSPGKRNPHLIVETKGDECVISIRDFGIGVPQEDREHLFESFYRGNNTKEFPGTGLGLVIAKEFIDLQGGNIGYESPEEEGSLFWISFPLTVEKVLQPSH